jgi:hypothetical protein
MEYLYRSATPAYKGNHAQPSKPTGLLAGLGSVMGGGATPAYRTVVDASAHAPAQARSWWQAFAVTPSYKAAAPCMADASDPCASSPDDGDDDADPERGCAEQAMQVVIL